MALVMKLENVVIERGRYVYSRRIPVDIKHLYPPSKEPFFRVPFSVQQEGAELVAEHAALQSAYARMVHAARDRDPDAIGAEGMERYKEMARASLDDPRTEREKWLDKLSEAEQLVRSVKVGPYPFDADGFDLR